MTRWGIFALVGLLAVPLARSADAQQAPGNCPNELIDSWRIHG
jgi:hypothetical protein